MKSILFHGDKVIWAIFALLCLISLVEVYSAGSILTYKDGRFWSTLVSQAGFLAIGTGFVWLFHNIPCRWFKLIPLPGYIAAVIALIAALAGGESINGGARWLHIPFTSFTFQPSEFAKLVLVVTVALILTTNQDENGAKPTAFKAILIFTGIICGLIVTQNFSTAAMIFGVIFLMMIVGRVPVKQLAMLVVAGIAGAIAFVIVLVALPSDPNDDFYDSMLTQRFSTWKSRITTDDMNTSVPADSFVITDHNRQEVHARIAIARGEGKGVMPGNSVERDFLAQADSDFIYAIISEETGLWGAATVTFLYIVLLVRAGRIASRCERNFPAFLVMGLALMLVSQAMLNMMVAVGLFPVTGQTLPMISRGGTSTLITCIYFGMILSISRYARSNGKGALEEVVREAHRDDPEPVTEQEALIAEAEEEFTED